MASWHIPNKFINMESNPIPLDGVLMNGAQAQKKRRLTYENVKSGKVTLAEFLGGEAVAKAGQLIAEVQMLMNLAKIGDRGGSVLKEINADTSGKKPNVLKAANMLVYGRVLERLWGKLGEEKPSGKLHQLASILGASAPAQMEKLIGSYKGDLKWASGSGLKSYKGVLDEAGEFAKGVALPSAPTAKRPEKKEPPFRQPRNLEGGQIRVAIGKAVQEKKPAQEIQAFAALPPKRKPAAPAERKAEPAKKAPVQKKQAESQKKPARAAGKEYQYSEAVDRDSWELSPEEEKVWEQDMKKTEAKKMVDEWFSKQLAMVEVGVSREKASNSGNVIGVSIPGLEGRLGKVSRAKKALEQRRKKGGQWRMYNETLFAYHLMNKQMSEAILCFTGNTKLHDRKTFIKEVGSDPQLLLAFNNKIKELESLAKKHERIASRTMRMLRRRKLAGQRRWWVARNEEALLAPAKGGSDMVGVMLADAESGKRSERAKGGETPDSIRKKLMESLKSAGELSANRELNRRAKQVLVKHMKAIDPKMASVHGELERAAQNDAVSIEDAVAVAVGREPVNEKERESDRRLANIMLVQAKEELDAEVSRRAKEKESGAPGPKKGPAGVEEKDKQADASAAKPRKKRGLVDGIRDGIAGIRKWLFS